ncbi:MAG: hypothetical protein ACLU3I_10175 [Acutalibacteraceae bacterium]
MNAVKKAAALGAKIACGSDAGAYRVLRRAGQVWTSARSCAAPLERVQTP